MPKINDGGPAFSTTWDSSHNAGLQIEPGMSRRDWISGQALVGLLASGQWHSRTVQPGFAEHIVMQADEIADAWLAARAEGGAE